MEKNRVQKTQSVGVGNQHSLPNFRGGHLLTRFGVASPFQPKVGWGKVTGEKGESNPIVCTLAYQFCFDGYEVEYSVSIPVDSKLWFGLPPERKDREETIE